MNEFVAELRLPAYYCAFNAIDNIGQIAVLFTNDNEQDGSSSTKRRNTQGNIGDGKVD